MKQLYFFQYQCENGNANSTWTVTNTSSLTECGYSSGDIVICKISAATSIGYGPSTDVRLVIDCDCMYKFSSHNS